MGQEILNTCSKEKFNYQAEGIYSRSSVWKIDNKNIQMNVYCSFDSSGNYYELSATASSLEGRDFVKQQFMKSNDTVSVSDGDFSVNISAKVLKKYGMLLVVTHYKTFNKVVTSKLKYTDFFINL